MDQRPSIEELKNLEKEKSTRFIAIKNWEDSRVQSSQIFRSIVTQIHKKLTNHLENDNEYLVCIIRYFKEKVNQDMKYSQQQLPSIPDNPFNELIAHFAEQQKQKQESCREFANYVDLELLSILQQELNWKTFQNYKSSVSKRIAQIESLVKNVGNKYKDYGKTYMDAQKQAIKNKECDKDLYCSEFPYIQEALELHNELKALGKEVMEFAEIGLKQHAERLFKIQKFFQMYLEKASQLGIMTYKEDLFSQFKPQQLTFDKLLNPQDSNYILQQLNNDETQTNENQIALVLRYIDQYILIEPNHNPLLLAKFQGQYEKSPNKVKQVTITITIDKYLDILYSLGILSSTPKNHYLYQIYIPFNIHILMAYCIQQKQKKPQLVVLRLRSKYAVKKMFLMQYNNIKIEMLQQRYDEPNWMSDDHNEMPDDVGFEKETVEKFDLFTQKSFELPRFPRQEQIKQLALSEQMFLIITRSNNIYRWRPEIESECQLLDLPEQSQGGLGQKLAGALLAGAKKTTKDIVLDRIFLNAHHAIICSDSGDNFYMNYKENKLRQLEQLKGKIVKTIAWNELSDETDTNEILIATKDSKILLYRIDLRQSELREAEAKAVVTIPNERQINQIETFTMVLDNSRYACVVVSTNFSVFFFYGANSLDILFSKYRDPQSVMRAESASNRSHTSLLSLCYSKTAKPRATSFLYTNGKSLNLYILPDKDLNEGILTSFKTLKCSNTEMPIQVGLTEFHYFILTSDQLIIHSRITQLEVQKYELRGQGRIMGMQYEKSSEAFWIYSEKGVCKVDVSNEDKDAWKLLMDQKMFIEAYEIGKKYNSPYTAYIAGLCGDQLFNKKKYSEAAQYYEKSSQNFEEIFLKYLSCDDMKARIGLEKYLKHLLEDLKGESQRTMLLGWLVELYIYRLNEIDKMTLESKIYENDTQRDRDQKERKQRQKELNEEFEQFLKDYQEKLPQDLVYQVMVSHGRLANCVEYAKLNSNFGMIIQHHINEENYKDTIKNLKNVKDKDSMEVIQKYSYILMKHEPEQSLQILMTHIKKFDSTKIIGGLMNIPIEKRNCGIQFLEHSINTLGCAEKSINNILIFFLTQPPQKEKLHDYLLMQEQLLHEKEKVNFDLDFALRLFKQASLIDAQIIIYGMMGLYTESVTLALDYEMIEKAKDYASRPLDDDKKKKLWMMIAERLLKNNQSIDKVIELTKQAEMIKIEDLLPHFNENIKIEHFKDEICNSLRKYNEDIDKLKDDMKKLSQNSDQLKNELKMTKNKFLIIDTQQKCEHCGKHLFNDTFYIFPCNHGFHKDCIVKKLKSLPQHQAKMAQIETYDMTMQSILMKSNPQQKQKQQDGQSFFQLMNIFGTTKQESRPQSSLTQEEEKLLKETKEKFDILVANECIFCGPSVVDSIQIGFEIDAEEKSTWSL